MHDKDLQRHAQDDARPNNAVESAASAASDLQNYYALLQAVYGSL